MIYYFIEPQEHGCCYRLDHRSFRMRTGESADGIHGIPQRLHHVLDLVAVVACNQEKPLKAGDLLQLRANLVQEMARVSIA